MKKLISLFLIAVVLSSTFMCYEAEASVLEEAERVVMAAALKYAGVDPATISQARFNEMLEWALQEIAVRDAEKVALQQAAKWSMYVGKVFVPLMIVNFVVETISLGYNIYDLGKSAYYAFKKGSAMTGEGSVSGDSGLLGPFDVANQDIIMLHFEFSNLTFDEWNGMVSYVQIYDNEYEPVVTIWPRYGQEGFVNFDIGFLDANYMSHSVKMPFTNGSGLVIDIMLDKQSNTCRYTFNGIYNEVGVISPGAFASGSLLYVQKSSTNCGLTYKYHGMKSEYSVQVVGDERTSDGYVNRTVDEGVESVSNSDVMPGRPQEIPDNWLLEDPPQQGEELVISCPDVLKLRKGDTYRIQYSPADAVLTGVSSDVNVAVLNGDIIEAVGEGTASITLELVKGSQSVTKTITVEVSEVELPTEPIDLTPLLHKATQKFPFSLPWDLAYLVGCLRAEPKPPVFEYEIGGVFGGAKFRVDMTFLDPIMPFVRSMQVIAFCALLVIATSRLFGGAK